MSAAICVENLGKCYQVTNGSERPGYRTLRESLVEWVAKPFGRRHAGTAGRPADEFWALRGVDLEVSPGEVLAVIGRNGAGKSTLLKVLSRITKPTTGQVTLRGRVGSLLEVGTGFHPELTGRENISLNGAILGMTRGEIARKFDDIVEFAGVQKFLDTPVKRYSSGMYVRLAFAVAAHLDLEVLLVDEVLAVGDIAFQQKCLGKMNDIARSGRTVLLVSHNLAMLSNLCTRAVWLNCGRVQECGTPTEVIASYCKHVATMIHEGSSVSLVNHPGRPAGCERLFERVTLLDEQDTATSSVPIGGALTIELELTTIPRRSETGIVLDVCDQFGTVLARANSRVQSRIDFGAQQYNKVRCSLQNLRLLPGSYQLNVAIGDGQEYQDRIEGALRFSVEATDIYGTGQIPTSRYGIIALEALWQTPEVRTAESPAESA